MRLLAGQFQMEWKLFRRDRMAMFWTFLFPVVMLLGFGVIFRSGSTTPLTLVSVTPPSPVSDGEALLEALSHAPVKVLALSAREAEARWQRGETAAQLEWSGGGYR